MSSTSPNSSSSAALPRVLLALLTAGIVGALLWAMIFANPERGDSERSDAGTKREDSDMDPQKSSVPADSSTAKTTNQERPHIVHILSDDQRIDSMPGVRPEVFPQDLFSELRRCMIEPGITFAAAYNTNPLCAPARGSLLGGGYMTHNTGVMTNQWPNGSAERFRDAVSIGTLMQARGYRTAFIGKYLNGHPELIGTDSKGKPIRKRAYVPPGWDVFLHRQFSANWFQNAFVVGTSGPRSPESGLYLPPERERLQEYTEELEANGFPPSVAQLLRDYDFEHPPYVTNFERDLTLALLEDSDSERPWLIIVAVEPPHQPSQPDRPDAGRYADFVFDSPGLRETDLSDKPAHVRAAAERTAKSKPIGPFNNTKDLWSAMLESMLSLDRMVGSICDTVDQDPKLRGHTALFFSSDNGYMWGEHGLRTKRHPYQESILSPLVVRMPGQRSGARDGSGAEKALVERHQPVAVNLDLPATMLHLAGVSEKEIREELRCDGLSLLPLLENPEAEFREHMFCQSFGTEALSENFDDSTWFLASDGDFKLIEHGYLNESGQPAREFYDLRTDPFELKSMHAMFELETTLNFEYSEPAAKLAETIERERGLAIVDLPNFMGELHNGRAGNGYRYQFKVRGGQAPYRFELFPKPVANTPRVRAEKVKRKMPLGLRLDEAGLLQGQAKEAGRFEFAVQVTDSSRSAQHGGPQTFARRVRVTITD